MLLLLQGEYLGISCRAAKGRYLQVRKRGRPHRLCFYSTHWGVWEQWQVWTLSLSYFSRLVLRPESPSTHKKCASHAADCNS